MLAVFLYDGYLVTAFVVQEKEPKFFAGYPNPFRDVETHQLGESGLGVSCGTAHPQQLLITWFQSLPRAIEIVLVATAEFHKRCVVMFFHFMAGANHCRREFDLIFLVKCLAQFQEMIGEKGEVRLVVEEEEGRGSGEGKEGRGVRVRVFVSREEGEIDARKTLVENFCTCKSHTTKTLKLHVPHMWLSIR